MKKGSTINLISPEVQDNIRFELLSSLVIRIGMAVFVTLGMLIILLFTSVFYLQTIQGGIERQISALENLSKSLETSGVKQQAQTSIAFIQAVANLSQDKFNWSTTISAIVEALPENIYLTNIAGNQTQKQVTLEGRAPDRESVLNAKDALGRISFVKEVQSPLSNVIPERDIHFQFTLILK